MLIEDLHLSISDVLGLGGRIINKNTVNQNQATKSNRNLRNYEHQSRPAHSSESSSHSVDFMLDDSIKDASASVFVKKINSEKRRAGSL